MKFSRSKNKGFTLIELLVVVAIISLLSSIVLATLKDAREKAQGIAFRQHVDQFVRAIELYKANHNGNLPFPDMIADYYYETRFDKLDTHGNYDLVGSILKNESLISSVPFPPFPNTTGDARFLFIRYSGYKCGPGAVSGVKAHEYMIWISGGKNVNYFSDWGDLWQGYPVAPESKLTGYKCFAFK